MTVNLLHDRLLPIKTPDLYRANQAILCTCQKYNISLGTAYFAYVLDVVDKFPMYAIGGYNGGPNAMNKWRDKHKNITDLDEFVEKIPYPESKNYIKKVYRSRYNYSKVYGK